MSKLKVILGLIPEHCAEDSVVEIEDFSITYCQPADCNSNKDDYQHLKVTARQNGMGENGWYFDIETVNGHWSISDPLELTNIVNDAKKRMELNITKENDLKVYERKHDC